MGIDLHGVWCHHRRLRTCARPQEGEQELALIPADLSGTRGFLAAGAGPLNN
jgi:hypothetical protein